MPERMGKAYSGLGEANDSADYTYGCVRREANYKMPDQIVREIKDALARGEYTLSYEKLVYVAEVKTIEDKT